MLKEIASETHSTVHSNYSTLLSDFGCRLLVFRRVRGLFCFDLHLFTSEQVSNVGSWLLSTVYHSILPQLLQQGSRRQSRSGAEGAGVAVDCLNLLTICWSILALLHQVFLFSAVARDSRMATNKKRAPSAFLWISSPSGAFELGVSPYLKRSRAASESVSITCPAKTNSSSSCCALVY